MAICMSALLGLTGGRQAFSYLFMTDIVPMTHISFVSMWFSGSLALAVLAQCCYFLFYPHWKIFLIFNISFGAIVALSGILLLSESPMHNLLLNKSAEATQSLDRIKKFNGLGSRSIQLYELQKRIRLSRYDKRERSLGRYTCCANMPTGANVLIVIGLQLISSISIYLLWFQYRHLDGQIFRHTLIASTSFFLGCLMGGILLSKMSTSRIKTSKGKVRNLRCVFISMFSISLIGSLLLIMVQKITL